MADYVVDQADFTRRERGRPRNRVISPEPMQVDVEVATRIVGIVLDRLTEDGSVLESSQDILYTHGGRRLFAQKMLHELSKPKYGVVSDVPAEALSNSLGRLIKVGKGPKVDGRRAQMHYVATAGATTMELAASWNVGRKRTAEQGARQSMLNELYAAVLPTMPADVTLNDLTRQQLDTYHRRTVERDTAFQFN